MMVNGDDDVITCILPHKLMKEKHCEREKHINPCSKKWI